MQALAARQAAFCSSSSSAGRRPAARSRRAVTVRADVGFCRDKISERQDLTDQIEGTSVVVFLGADGAEVPVECPKVRWEGLGRMCGGGSNTEGGCKRCVWAQEMHPQLQLAMAAVAASPGAKLHPSCASAVVARQHIARPPSSIFHLLQ